MAGTADSPGAGSSQPGILKPWICGALVLTGIVFLVFGQIQWGALLLARGLPWIVAGILVAAAATFLPPLRTAMGPRGAAPPLLAVEIVFLVVLTLGGGFVRFAGLDHLPPGGFFDEVEYHRVAENILAGDRPIFIRDIQLPALFVYLLAAGLAVAGKGLATVRGVAALLGTITLPVFYLLARRAFRRPVAAATAILLAGSRWHITFSRVVFSAAITGPLLEVLAVLFLWRAVERRRRVDYVLFGLTVGIGLQTYYSFNLFPAVLAVAVLGYAGRSGWSRFRAELVPILKGLAWSVAVGVVVLTPLAFFAVRNPGDFFQRTNTVAIWAQGDDQPVAAALERNVVTHLLMFNFQGDGNPRHNIPDAPLLNPAEGVALALGLGFALGRGFRWPQSLWLAWFAVMLLPAILTIEAPQAHRAVGAIPAVYLLIGCGLQGLFSLAAENAGKARAVLAAAVLLAASVAGAYQDAWRYFRIQVVHPLVWSAFMAEHHALAAFLKPFGGRYEIRVSPLYYGSPILNFRLGKEFPYKRFRLSDDLPLALSDPGKKTEGAVYALEPFQRELFPLFQALYPHARVEEHRDPAGRPMFVSVVVPREDLDHPSDPRAAQEGLLGAYYSNEEWRGKPEIVRREPAVIFHFHWEEEALPGTFTADWAAHLQVEQAGAYGFRMVTSGPTVLLIDDQKVIETHDFESDLPHGGSITLSPGEHRIVIRYVKKGYMSMIWLVWQPPSGGFSAIPLRLLRPLSEEDYLALRSRLPLPHP
ncbi:MAG TPA: glycosyltransferase family 39 protein [Thermoanaerobaculia bacterium]|nr:glycosyltransferase family 39 protein [Thermoanaerobaculia bacterium]